MQSRLLGEKHAEKLLMPHFEAVPERRKPGGRRHGGRQSAQMVYGAFGKLLPIVPIGRAGEGRTPPAPASGTRH